MRIEMITGGPSITLDVIMPEKWHKYKMENARVIWMLHDKFDTSGDWISFTQAEVFAEDHEFVIVCPTTNSARYNDWVNGCKWQTFLTEGLYDYVHEMFPLSKKPEDNILFGYGRGGYGAIKYVLACPDKYGSAYSVSYDDGFVVNYLNSNPGPAKFDSGYGTPAEVAVSQENIPWFAEQYAKSAKPKPLIYLASGTQSKTYARNVEIRDRLIELGYDVTWEESDSKGGWRFCNEQLERVLNLADK